MSIFDKFRAHILEPLSAWTYKSRNPVYPQKTSGFQVIKSELSKYDPLQQKIKKWGARLAQHLIGYNKLASGTYPIFKYPAIPSSSAQKVSDRIPYQKEFAKKHLTSAPSNWATDGQHSRLINFVDAETSSLKGSNVLSWSRLGVTYNYGTGKFEYVSSEDRFFLSRGGYTAGAEEVNRLNEQNITDFRTRHKVKYGKYYDEKEAAYLRSQVAGSVLAGHNILAADVGWLFGNVKGMSTMDTLVAAHNIYGKGGAGLEKLFSRLYKGLKPSALGIQPHLSQHDVLMNVLVFEEMLRNAELNKDFKYIDKFIGAEYAPTDYYNGLKSSIILNNQYVIPRGTNIKARWDATKDTYYTNVIAEKYAEAVGASDYDPKKDIYGYDEEGNPVVNEGFSIIEPGEEGRVDLIGLNETPEDRATTKWLEEEERRLRESATKKVTAKAKSKQRLIDKLVNEVPSTGGSNIMEAKEWAEFVAVVKDLTRAAGTLGDEYRNISELKASEARRETLSIGTRIASYAPEDAVDFLNALDIKGNEQDAYINIAKKIQRQKQVEGKTAIFEKAENLYASGWMKDKVFDRLTQELNDSTVSLKDFKKSVNEAVQTVEAKRQALLSYGSQQFYDPQALINATKHEWKSIMGAASGFMPAPVMSPISHYGTAIMNGLQSSLSGIKKWTSPINYGAQVAGNALIGSGVVSLDPALVGAGLVVKGTAALGTQLYGKYKENQISQVGQDISMRLNLVSAGVQTVLLPFKLLATAARRLTKIFGGLSAVTAGFMYSGLKDMTHMGNPLSNLTGAGYGTYYNTMAGDYASLLAPGSTNAMMENLAAGSSMLYTMGQMDTNRVIASSMLGTFSNVYSANPDSMENITSMINHISGQMQGASPGRKRDLMTWASIIDANLPKILQSMDTLGISDYQTFMNPTAAAGVRWTANRGNDYMESWRKSFQMDQYQFQAINTNLGFNKDRIVHKMWQSFGFTLYNGFNKIVEMIADGRWKEAFDTISGTIGEVINKIKESDAFKEFTGSFKDFIETLKKGKVGDILRGIHQTFKEIGKQIIAGILEGIEPLISYLGDITFDPWKLAKGENPFGMKDYGKERLDKISPEAAAYLEQFKVSSGPIMDASGNITYGSSFSAKTIKDLRQSLLREKDKPRGQAIMEHLGLTVEDLESDKSLARKFGVMSDFERGFKQFQKSGVAEQMYEQMYDTGVKTISGAVSGVAGAISNVIKNETYVRLYIDGQAVASTFIDAAGKLTKTGKGLLKAFVDEKGGM